MRHTYVCMCTYVCMYAANMASSSHKYKANGKKIAQPLYCIFYCLELIQDTTKKDNKLTNSASV